MTEEEPRISLTPQGEEYFRQLEEKSNISDDPEWFPFEPDGESEEAVLFVARGEIYKVIGESADGWLLAMPLNLVLMSRLQLPPKPPQK